MKFTDELMRTRSALFHDGWLKFNEETWGFKSERVVYRLPGKELPSLETVLYLDKRGRVRMPPCNPYLPLQFSSTSTEKNCQLYTQLTSVMKLLAEDVKRRGVSGSLAFPPGFLDARAFQWLGFETTFNYTFVAHLPFYDSNLDTSVRKNSRKAEREGCTVKRSHNWDEVIYCINKTAQTKGFDYLFDVDQLTRCSEILGDHILFAHIGYSAELLPISAQVKISMPDGICIDWLAGTDRSFINSGINQYLYSQALNEITIAGSKYFDYCGANIESVARAKAAWGFDLVPYITIVDHSLVGKAKKAVGHVRGARKFWHFIRRNLLKR